MEFDHPHVLLQNRKGYFSKMVAETGAAMAPMLHEMAKEVHDEQYFAVHVLVLSCMNSFKCYKLMSL